MSSRTAVIVAAHEEADRLPATLAALASAFPRARVLVADDGSRDATAARAAYGGAEVVRSERVIGKGGAVTRAAELLLEPALRGELDTVVLCDGDLGASAARLSALDAAVRAGDCDLAVAAFARRLGGGFGIAVGFARWAIGRLTGVTLDAPISGQRALRAELLPVVLPFAPRFGMEIGMTVDALRGGFRVRELELELEHRATGRSWSGFAHRGRQLLDFLAVYASRR